MIEASDNGSSARDERLHQIVDQAHWIAAVGMMQSDRGMQPSACHGTRHAGAQDRVAVIEQRIGAAGGAIAAEKSQRPTGGAIEIICFTGRCRAASRATYEPNEKPASHSASFGRLRPTHSATASRSSVSPRPSS